jgi:hypothetical protein
MIVTKDQLRRIIQETVKRKLDLGPDDTYEPGPPIKLEGRLTKDQLQQVIDEEYARAMERRQQAEAPKAARTTLSQCDMGELLEFARAYAALPLTAREQLDDLVNNPLSEDVNPNVLDLLQESLGGLNEDLDGVIQGVSDYGMDEEEGPDMGGTPPGLDEESMEDKQQKMHYDLDHDGERGESPEHKEKVLGHMDEEGMMPASLDQKAPPGRERQVKALKKKGNVDNPWAVAWASYNKSHKKK